MKMSLFLVTILTYRHIFIKYKAHQNPKLKYFSSRLAVVFAQSIEARCEVENEDAVGAAATGDVPTTSERSTILLRTKVPLGLNYLKVATAPPLTW